MEVARVCESDVRSLVALAAYGAIVVRAPPDDEIDGAVGVQGPRVGVNSKPSTAACPIVPFGFVRVSDTSSAAALCRVRTPPRFRGTVFFLFFSNRRDSIVTAPSVPAKEQTRPVRRRYVPFRGHSFHRFQDATCGIATRLAEGPIFSQPLAALRISCAEC